MLQSVTAGSVARTSTESSVVSTVRAAHALGASPHAAEPVTDDVVHLAREPQALKLSACDRVQLVVFAYQSGLV